MSLVFGFAGPKGSFLRGLLGFGSCVNGLVMVCVLAANVADRRFLRSVAPAFQRGAREYRFQYALRAEALVYQISYRLITLRIVLRWFGARRGSVRSKLLVRPIRNLRSRSRERPCNRRARSPLRLGLERRTNFGQVQPTVAPLRFQRPCRASGGASGRLRIFL